jgi:hypothetical protein
MHLINLEGGLSPPSPPPLNPPLASHTPNKKYCVTSGAYISENIVVVQ